MITNFFDSSLSNYWVKIKDTKQLLNDVHQKISKRTQKQLQAFAEENPEIKQPDPEYDQSLKR
jgi:hypothetical protein